MSYANPSYDTKSWKDFEFIFLHFTRHEPDYGGYMKISIRFRIKKYDRNMNRLSVARFHGLSNPKSCIKMRWKGEKTRSNIVEIKKQTSMMI